MMSLSSSPPDPESQRLQTLIDYAVLDTEAETAFDEITALAAGWFEVPIALVSLVDRDRQWFKSRIGLAVCETSREIAFCDHAIRSPEVMVVEDARADQRFADNPLVRGEPGMRFYAGAPLISAEGHAVGTLCLIDRVPRRFSQAQRNALAVLARQVVAQFELRRQHATLGVAYGELRTERDRLHRVQQQLQSSEERMALVLQGANDGWWDWDLSTGERYYSPRGWSMLGYRVEELPYDSQLWERLVSPEDRPEIERAFAAALRSGANHYEAEMRLRHRDGHHVPVLTRGFILRDAGGRAVRLSGTNTDLTDFRRAEQARRESQERYELLYANSMEGVMLTRPSGSVVAANPAACAMFGMSEAEVCLRGRSSLVDLSDPRAEPLLLERAQQGRARGELRMLRGNGEPFEVEITSSIYTDRDGEPVAATVFRDITERHTWARRLQESHNLLANLAQHVPGVIYQFRLYPDGSSCFPFASEGLWRIYEVNADEVREDATPVFNRIHPDDVAAVSAAIGASALTLQAWHQEYRVILPAQGEGWRQGDAQPERLPDGSVLWHGFITDITERKQAQDYTHRLAFFDALTGLPNRRLLHDRMEHALASATRAGRVGALLFIDLDNFKQINDARGHSVGDELLRQVSQRLERLLRSEDTVARLGGDEFVVLLGNLGPDTESGSRHAIGVAEKIRDLLENPYEIEGLAYSVTGSIGITLFPKAGERVDDLLREADTAMYRAKAAGRNRIAFFEPAMQAEVEQRLALEQDLNESLLTEQLQLHVQPQFDAQRREVGAELLLRWQHPVRGSVPPAQFIPVAEASGLILRLGERVIAGACEALARMKRAGRLLPLSVNVSPRQFHSENFVAGVRAALEASGAPASALIFEVTEGLLIENWEETRARMAELVALGIRFSIDDFGTGYSSLAYLKKLPLYELKIDRSFVRDIPHDASDTAIVQSILSVARHLKLHVVAEGVETQAQADFLVANACEGLQGYLYARPMPMGEWLERRLEPLLAG